MSEEKTGQEHKKHVLYSVICLALFAYIFILHLYPNFHSSFGLGLSLEAWKYGGMIITLILLVATSYQHLLKPGSGDAVWNAGKDAEKLGVLKPVEIESVAEESVVEVKPVRKKVIIKAKKKEEDAGKKE